jgi:hypothetical protein
MAVALPEHVKGWNIGPESSPMSVAEVIFWAGGLIYEAGGPIDEDLTRIDPKHASAWVESSKPLTTVMQIDTVGGHNKVLRPMAAILHFCVERATAENGPNHHLVIPEHVVRQTDKKDRTGIQVLRGLGFDDSYAFGEGSLVAHADHLKDVIDSRFPEFAGAIVLPQASNIVPGE